MQPRGNRPIPLRRLQVAQISLPSLERRTTGELFGVNELPFRVHRGFNMLVKPLEEGGEGEGWEGGGGGGEEGGEPEGSGR